VEELIERLRSVPDPRSERGKRHALADLLFIALVAMVSGADDAEAMETFGRVNVDWFKTFLDLPHGIPSQDTFLRVFAVLRPEDVQGLFAGWVQAARAAATDEHLAIDGKTLRRSFDTASGGRAIHMVSAWLSDQGLVLGQVKVDEKENEIVAIPELLRILDVRGLTVTIDAMGCQRAIAEAIVGAGANYVLTVKGNHPTLHEHIQLFFDDALRSRRSLDDPRPEVEVVSETDGDHGRIETRTCWFSRDLSWVDQRAEWSGLSGLAMIRRERMDRSTGRQSEEVAYFIVAHPTATAARVARWVRSHWGIENSLHWTLDMVFDEDQCRVRVGHAAQNLAVLRHLVMNLFRDARSKKKRSLTKHRQLCGWNREYMLAIVAGLPLPC
jgi:predicted transposase YbfD/YdcC